MTHYMQAAGVRIKVNTIYCNSDRAREYNEDYTGNPTSAGDEDTWSNLSNIDWGDSAPFMDGGDAGNKTVRHVTLIFELCLPSLETLVYGTDFSHSEGRDANCNNDNVVVPMPTGGISVSVSMLQTQAQ
jgi:glycosidase